MIGFDFHKELYQMMENYEKDPLTDIKLSRPSWLDSSDPMSEIYLKKSQLLQNGKLVYASIVQANTILFKTFPPYNCPAQIVFSADPYFSDHPEILRDISRGIYSFKGKDMDAVPEQWHDVSRVITDEYDRSGFTFRIDSDDNSPEYHMITTMIFRKLLPKGKLCGNILPVFCLPDCKQVMILPKKYWTKKFKNAWINGFI